MNPLILKYPLDINQNNPGNWIANEPFDLSSQFGKKYRCVTFSGGYFFSDTVTIQDNSGNTLVPEIDYQITHLNVEAVELSGKSVCGMLVITNPHVNNTVYLSGHLVGGKYVTLSPIIQDCLKTLEGLSTAAPNWNDILNKPDDFFPSGHFMLWGQMYGFTPFTLSVKELTKTIVDSSIVSLDNQLIQQTVSKNNLLRKMELIKETLEFHTRIGNNSHRTSATDIGLADVDNYPIVTTEEIADLSNNIPVRYVDTTKHNEVTAYWLNRKLTHYHPIALTELNTYSKAEIDLILSNLYNKTDSVPATQALENKTVAEIGNNLPTKYDAAGFKTGLFPTNKLTDQTPPANSVLCNDQQFYTVTDLMTKAFPDNKNLLILGSYFSISDALQDLNNNYSNNSATYALFTLEKNIDLITSKDKIYFDVMASRTGTVWSINGV